MSLFFNAFPRTLLGIFFQDLYFKNFGLTD